jgi:hypothetical protein
MLMKSFLGLAAVASLGVAAIAPSAQAQMEAPLLLADGHLDIETMENFQYDLEYDDLTRTGFICLNNPMEECGGEAYEVSDDHVIPNPDYDVETPEGFACVNNVNPACHNPRHYGVYYEEVETVVTNRTDAVFSELDTSTSSDVTLPPRTTAPAPAPIQGLW